MNRVEGFTGGTRPLDTLATAITPTQLRAVHLAIGEEPDAAEVLGLVNRFAGYSTGVLLVLIKGMEGHDDPRTDGDLKGMKAAVAWRSAA